MQIKSVFKDGERIPSRFTCDGKNVNPPLEFIDVPDNTESLALIVDDLDSSAGTFTHWVMWDISPDTKNIKENSAPKEAREGTNDFGKVGYGGPCPHSGKHRYQFKLYALDNFLDLLEGSKADVEKAMQDHILVKAVLTGNYFRGE